MPNLKRLPRTPSKLLRKALDDVTVIQKDPRYKFEDTMWHNTLSQGEHKDKCHVCFAGAVIANTLKGDIKDRISPDDFDNSITNKLEALDEFRKGQIYNALTYLDVSEHKKNKVSRYMHTPAIMRGNITAWKASMEKIIKILEKENL